MKLIQLFDIKTITLGFAFCQPPKKALPKSHPKKVTTKFQTQKKSSDRKFQTQKRASHIPVTYIPDYPPWVRKVNNAVYRINRYHTIRCIAFCPVESVIHISSFKKAALRALNEKNSITNSIIMHHIRFSSYFL